MFHMLRMSRWLIPIVLVAICFAEDRNWEEANQLLVKASDAETFKPEQTEVPLDSQGLAPTYNQGESGWHIRPGLYGAGTVGGPVGNR